MEAGQEFFVVFDTPDTATVDRSSPYEGRSFVSATGVTFVSLSSVSGPGNFNIRARIRTGEVEPQTVSCDFNADGRVDTRDAVELLRFIREHPGDAGGDFNRDGRAGLRDVLGMLLAHLHGDCP